MSIVKKLGVAAVVMGLVSVGMGATGVGRIPTERGVIVRGMAAEMLLANAALAKIKGLLYGDKYNLDMLMSKWFDGENIFVQGDKLYDVAAVRVRIKGIGDESAESLGKGLDIFVGVLPRPGIVDHNPSGWLNGALLSGDKTLLAKQVASIGKIDDQRVLVTAMPEQYQSLIAARFMDPRTFKIGNDGRMTAFSRNKWIKASFNSAGKESELWLADSGDKRHPLAANATTSPWRAAFDPQSNGFFLVQNLSSKAYNTLVSRGKRFVYATY